MKEKIVFSKSIIVCENLHHCPFKKKCILFEGKEFPLLKLKYENIGEYGIEIKIICNSKGMKNE
ncbi:MAG: hypothetical protein KAX49_13750 [Halanaerobiales bacterium]|nr:hypothetical protein [Halanaerobiales bacterium]